MAEQVTGKPLEMSFQVRLEATVMAVREQLMKYYKGTCVESVTRNNNVGMGSVVDYMSNRGRHLYEREALQHRNPKFIRIGSYPILSVEHIPDSLTYHLRVLEMSEGLKTVHSEVQDFMRKYLPSVRTSVNTKPSLGKGVKFEFPKDQPNDKELFKAEPNILFEEEDNWLQLTADYLGVPLQILNTIPLSDQRYHNQNRLLAEQRRTQLTYTDHTTLTWTTIPF
jgi:hypothetical protein